jgi:uncharacterized NAD-dependent epimerase/dehydratase family protein
MLEMQRDEQHPNRRFCVAMVPTLESVRSAVDSFSASYCLFSAVNATSIDDDALRKTARSLLERGIAYFCLLRMEVRRRPEQLRFSF